MAALAIAPEIVFKGRQSNPAEDFKTTDKGILYCVEFWEQEQWYAQYTSPEYRAAVDQILGRIFSAPHGSNGTKV